MKIPRTAFNAVKCCDPEVSRYALGGVRLERTASGIPYAVATCGRSLVVLSWYTDEQGELGVIAPHGICRVAADKRTLPNLGDRVELQEGEAGVGGQRIAIGPTDGPPTLVSEALDGRYPRWRDVIPKDNEEDLHISVDARLLRKVLAAIVPHVEVDDSVCEVVISVPKNDGAPLRITAKNADGYKAMGALMPYGDDRKPAWDVVKEEKVRDEEHKRRFEKEHAHQLGGVPSEPARVWPASMYVS